MYILQGEQAAAIPYLEPSGNYNSVGKEWRWWAAIPYLEPSGNYNPQATINVSGYAIPYLEPSGNYNALAKSSLWFCTIPYLEPSGYYKYAFIIPLYSVFRNTHKDKSVQVIKYTKSD